MDKKLSVQRIRWYKNMQNFNSLQPLVAEILVFAFDAYHRFFGGDGLNMITICSLRWRHNEQNGVSSHQPLECLFYALIKPTSKKTWKVRVTGLCEENSPVTGEFSSQMPVTRKMFPFDDVIMYINRYWATSLHSAIFQAFLLDGSHWLFEYVHR